jgi:hypothetical protein
VAHQQRQSARKLGTSTPPAPATATAPKAGTPPLPARTVNQNPAAASLPGLSDRDFDGAYQRYLSAHRELGIEDQAIPKDKMRSRLGKQLPKILDEKKCERVRLEIAVEDGKVRLRAWPGERSG